MMTLPTTSIPSLMNIWLTHFLLTRALLPHHNLVQIHILTTHGTPGHLLIIVKEHALPAALIEAEQIGNTIES